MVIPDTYEKEKWDNHEIKEKKERVAIEIKVDESMPKELSPMEKIDAKYFTMNETLNTMRD